MILIDDRILNDEKARTNSTTRSEVLASVFVDLDIRPGFTWHVGTVTSLSMPDIFNEDKSCGFEVVRCESENDICFEDSVKRCIDENAPIYTHKSTFPYFHCAGWMRRVYEDKLYNKLRKNAKGNYDGCAHNSLIILNSYKAEDPCVPFAIYSECLTRKTSDVKPFESVYFITLSGIYINNPSHIEYKRFNGGEYRDRILAMKSLLKIVE